MEQSAKLKLEGFEPIPRATEPSGVYALVAKGEVVYVGQAMNVYQRLTSHLNARYKKRSIPYYTEGDVKNRPMQFDSVLVKWVPYRDLDIVERELIIRFRPKYNIRILAPPKRVKVDLAAIGIVIRKEGDIKRRRVA